MSLGIEMMLKAMGFDPEKFKGEANALIGQVNKAFGHLSNELREIRLSQARIEKHLGIEPAATPQPLVNGGDHASSH